MRKLLISLLVLLPLTVSAVEVEIDGLWYNIITKAGVASVIQYKNDVKYSGDIVIPETVEYEGTPYPVTSIDDYAFTSCTLLTSITIPNSVTRIGIGAFELCWENLTSVTIGNNVTSIGRDAFSRCTGLTSFTIPNSVTSIEGNTFWLCSGLTSITIPNSVTSIGACAFEGCTGLTSITIPNSVTSIGTGVFAECTGLTSIGIPNSVTSIGNWSAFQGCSNLTSITIPNSVTSITETTFRNCSHLETVIIGGVDDIGSKAFANCPELTDVYYLSDNVPSISSDAFENSYMEYITLHVLASMVDAFKAADTWKDFKEIVAIADPTNISFADANVKAICVAHWDTNGDGEISTDEAAAVTSLGTVFKNNTDITSFDEFAYFTGVTSIAERAFEGCSSLTSITIPNSVTSIGKLAFMDCTNLAKVIVSDIAAWCRISFDDAMSNPLGYAQHLYSDENTEITDLVIPTSVTSIGNYVFVGCGLTSITIPTSVTSIGKGAFMGCGITSITIPNSVTSIADYAFSGCEDLTSITIPNSVTNIGEYAFELCTSLTKVIVSDIAAWCRISFDDSYSNPLSYAQHLYSDENTEITDLVLPTSVTSIGNYAFVGCGLTSITIPTSVTSIGEGAFMGCGLTSITIPNSVTSISNSAFSDCSGLTSVTIPNSVTSIGGYAFAVCSGLTSVTIPNSVTSIGEWAFSNCSSLTSVTVLNPTPVAITQDVFSNRTNATLYVPEGSKDVYQAAGYWNEFKEIVEMPAPAVNIAFADANVKAICVAHWDTDGDGELSYDEAAAVTTISDYFKKNTNITSFDELQYFTGMSSIAERAFEDCTNLTSVTISNSVTSIGKDAFAGCSSLNKVIVSDIAAWCNITFDYFYSNPLYFAHHLYSDASTEITDLVIPEGVTSIGDYAFMGGSSLTSIEIPNNVTSIGDYAFVNCSGLTSITISNSVTSIGLRAFYGCSGLTSITIPNNMTSIGECAFSGCSGPTLIEIPNSVTSIGNRAFEECSNLTAVSIPNSVTSIGNGAFFDCPNLTSITIPNSVTSIGEAAFLNCSSLTSVTVDINTPLAITSNTFSNRANATLYVPAGCKSAYEAADYWKEFKEIVEMVPDPDYVTIAMKTGGGAARSMVAYSSKYGLDFTNRPEIRAYIACGYSGKNKDVLLVHVNVVPPYTGMVIKTSNSIYDGGEYDVPTTTEDYYYANLLVPVVETQTVTPTETIAEVEYTNFAIGTLYGGGLGFVRINSNWTAQNKSYLRVPTSLYNGSASARQLGGFGIVFEDDETTGIDSLENPANTQLDKGAPMYNISGQRVGAGYKGVVIQNGKKILIK